MSWIPISLLHHRTCHSCKERNGVFSFSLFCCPEWRLHSRNEVSIPKEIRNSSVSDGPETPLASAVGRCWLDHCAAIGWRKRKTKSRSLTRWVVTDGVSMSGVHNFTAWSVCRTATRPEVVFLSPHLKNKEECMGRGCIMIGFPIVALHATF